jgi:hypothetical protein
MSITRSLFAALILAAPTARHIAAQRAPEIIDEAVRVGSHVRVSTITGKTYLGTVTRFSADTIALEVQGAVGALPTSAVKRLQLRVSKQSGYAFGAILGGILGGVGLYAFEHSREDVGATKVWPARAGATIGGTAGGIALGAVLGAAIHRDRWRDVVMPRP